VIEVQILIESYVYTLIVVKETMTINMGQGTHVLVMDHIFHTMGVWFIDMNIFNMPMMS